MMHEIRHILKAFHAPDRGHFGACCKCAHRPVPSANQGTADQRCGHPFAVGQPTAQARAHGGVCGIDGNLHIYQPSQPAQPALDLH